MGLCQGDSEAKMELEGEKEQGRQRCRLEERDGGAKRSAAAALQGYLGTRPPLGCVCDPRSDITSSRGWEMGKGEQMGQMGQIRQKRGPFF